MPTYRLAFEPSVTFGVRETREIADEGVFARLGRERPAEGVEKTVGVTRPDMDGVIRPREDDAEGGLTFAPNPIVGADSLVKATNTPHLGGHVKYRVL